MSPLLAHVRVKWLAPEHGGRKTPIVASQGRYTPTARFSGADSHFGVVMEFEPSAGVNPEEATIRLVNPQLAEVRRSLLANARLDIMEGPRKVADCLVVSVEPAPQEAAIQFIRFDRFDPGQTATARPTPPES
jgi:hypothetical protein